MTEENSKSMELFNESFSGHINRSRATQQTKVISSIAQIWAMTK